MIKQVLGDVSKELGLVKHRLSDLVSSDDRLVGNMTDYALINSGKLLRPGLFLLIATNGPAINSRPRRIQLACAIEMLHIATLLHDDVLDGAPTRRNQPSAASVFGDKSSVLLGDYIYATCLGLLAASGEHEPLQMLTKAMAVCVEGELAEQQMLFNTTLSAEEYMDIICKKSAELFRTCCRLGSLLAGHNAELTESLTRYGRLFGCGFQIVDDLLDFVGDVRAMGKPAGQDLKQGVITLPVILALDGSQSEAGHLRQRLDGFPQEVESEIRELVLGGNAPERTLDVAGQKFLDARASLDGASLGNGLAAKLFRLCDVTYHIGKDALSEFRRSRAN